MSTFTSPALSPNRKSELYTLHSWRDGSVIKGQDWRSDPWNSYKWQVGVADTCNSSLRCQSQRIRQSKLASDMSRMGELWV